MSCVTAEEPCWLWPDEHYRDCSSTHTSTIGSLTELESPPVRLATAVLWSLKDTLHPLTLGPDQPNSHAMLISSKNTSYGSLLMSKWISSTFLAAYEKAPPCHFARNLPRFSVSQQMANMLQKQ